MAVGRPVVHRVKVGCSLVNVHSDELYAVSVNAHIFMTVFIVKNYVQPSVSLVQCTLHAEH